MTFGAGLLLLIYPLFRYLTTEIAVTSQRIVFKTGLLARSVNEISVRRVEGASLGQTITGRILRYGTVSIRGTGRDIVPIRLVHDPLALQRAVNRGIDLAR